MAHHGTSWDGWRRWRARRLRMVRLWMLRLLRMQHELLILALCLVCGAVAPLAVSSSEIHGMELVAGCTAIAGEMCHARMLSPVPDGLIVRGFDRPEWQWSPGHRGVDISLNGMHELLAPSDGAISYSTILMPSNATSTLRRASSARSGKSSSRIGLVLLMWISTLRCSGNCSSTSSMPPGPFCAR